jgi:epoxide hydrolase-like predicted phosphatase
LGIKFITIENQIETMINTVVFDLGGIIEKHRTKQFCKKFARRHKISYKKFYHAWIRSRNRADLGKIMPSQFANELNKALGFSLKPKDYFDEYSKFVKIDVNLVKKMKRKLKGKYKLCILSNNNRVNEIDLLKFVNIYKIFDVVIISYKVGTIKPRKKIYKILFKKAHSRPEEMLFIDDLIENIKVARVLGMKGIVFKNKKQLKRDLRKHGICF